MPALVVRLKSRSLASQHVSQVISNRDFLARFEPGSNQSFILRSEATLIDLRLAQLVEEQQAIIDEKREIASQSGDNWHDGAFNATDNAAKVISDQASKLIKAREGLVVEEPTVEDQLVTLGSTVTVRQGRDQYELVIVGLSSLIESDHDHEYCSLASPIAQALIGNQVGATVTVNLGARQQVLTISGIDQSKIQKLITKRAEHHL